MHYLDNAATTPLDPSVRAFLAEGYADLWGNPSSDSELGRNAKRALEVARDLLCGMLGARELVFCGGGTEATNLAMRGSLARDSRRTILVGAADHPAVLETAADLELEGHTTVRYPVGSQGRVRLDEFTHLVEEHASRIGLVSILHGNNESGTLAPVESMIKAVRRHAPDAHVHVDAVQSFAKIAVDLDRFGADSVTIAAHKIHGPKGIGALALGDVRRPRTICTGGGQERGLRCGTEDVVSARAFALAAEHWISRQTEETGRVRALRDRAERELFAAIDGIELLGDSETRLPHLLPLGIRGVRGSMVRERLEAHEILVSTGSACASEHRETRGSHVHRAMGIVSALADGALRISFGRFNEEADVDALVRALPGIVAELRETAA
ncbi:MAG: cysteine desulfurase [Planctomycetes bacterium]|nr:cysteine desulfurase [Planctomycetota bacterium]